MKNPKNKVLKMKFALSDSLPINDKREQSIILDYIKKGLADKTIMEYNGNLFDLKSLNVMINLDCLNCHKVHSVLCCDGVGYPPFDDDCDKIFDMHEEILKDQCSEELYKAKLEHIKKYGLFVYSYNHEDMYGTMETYKDRTFRMHDGKCIFSVPIEKDKNDGGYKCAIHSYALSHGIDVFDLKPRACQLFPVDIITLFTKDKEEIDFVFGICDKTTFNRWHDIAYCVPYEESKKVYKETGAFNPKEYKPIYLGESGLLKGLYGKNTIKAISNGISKMNK